MKVCSRALGLLYLFDGLSLPYSFAGTRERCAPAVLATAMKPPAMNPGLLATDLAPPATTRGSPAITPPRGSPCTTMCSPAALRCRPIAPLCRPIAPRCSVTAPRSPTVPSTPRTSASCHQNAPSTRSRIRPQTRTHRLASSLDALEA